MYKAANQATMKHHFMQRIRSPNSQCDKLWVGWLYHARGEELVPTRHSRPKVIPQLDFKIYIFVQVVCGHFVNNARSSSPVTEQVHQVYQSKAMQFLTTNQTSLPCYKRRAKQLKQTQVFRYNPPTMPTSH